MDILDNLSHSSSAGQEYFPLPFFMESLYYALKNSPINFGKVTGVPVHIELDSSIDTDRLAKALQETFAAHANLSAALTEKDGRPYLIRSHYEQQPIPITEIKDEDAESTVQQFWGMPYQESDPMYRAAIFIAPSKIHLAGHFSHTLCDVVSLTMLFKEVFSRYDGKRVRTEDIDMFDWIAFHENFKKSDEAKQLIEEFKQELKGFAPVTPHPENAEPVLYQDVLLNNEEYGELAQFAKNIHTNVNNIILAAYSLALMRMDGRTNIAYQMSYHHRPTTKLLPIQACLVGRLPIIAKLPESDLVIDYLTQCDEFFKASSKKYYIVGQDINEKYADYIDTAIFNIIPAVGTIKVGGTEIAIKLPKRTPKRHSLYIYMNENPGGGATFGIMSTRYSVERLKELHYNIRHIAKSLMTAEKISEI